MKQMDLIGSANTGSERLLSSLRESQKPSVKQSGIIAEMLRRIKVNASFVPRSASQESSEYTQNENRKRVLESYKADRNE